MGSISPHKLFSTIAANALRTSDLIWREREREREVYDYNIKRSWLSLVVEVFIFGDFFFLGRFHSLWFGWFWMCGFFFFLLQWIVSSGLSMWFGLVWRQWVIGLVPIFVVWLVLDVGCGNWMGSNWFWVGYGGLLASYCLDEGCDFFFFPLIEERKFFKLF